MSWGKATAPIPNAIILTDNAIPKSDTIQISDTTLY